MVPWGPMWPLIPVSAWLQGKPVLFSIMRPYRGPALLPTAQMTPPPPNDSLSAVPHAGETFGDSVAVRMRLAPSLLDTQGGGVQVSWVRVSHRARLRSWLCSDPKGTLTFGTSGSHLAKWE